MPDCAGFLGFDFCKRILFNAFSKFLKRKIGKILFLEFR